MMQYGEPRLGDVYKDEMAAHYLFFLLEERDFDSVTLSHRVMPSWRQHVTFFESKPYKEWCLIYVDQGDASIRVGQIYLSKKDEIGIFLGANWQRRGWGSQAVRQMIQRHSEVTQFFANINPRNEPSMALFESLGFKELQRTYESGHVYIRKPES